MHGFLEIIKRSLAIQSSQWQYRFVVICASQFEAGQMQLQEALELLKQHGARSCGPGSGLWELNGHYFHFLSAKGSLQSWVDRLQGSTVLVMCEMEDFGEHWEYVRDILMQLHRTGSAYVMVPHVRTRPEYHTEI